MEISIHMYSILLRNTYHILLLKFNSKSTLKIQGKVKQCIEKRKASLNWEIPRILLKVTSTQIFEGHGKAFSLHVIFLSRIYWNIITFHEIMSDAHAFLVCLLLYCLLCTVNPSFMFPVFVL